VTRGYGVALVAVALSLAACGTSSGKKAAPAPAPAAASPTTQHSNAIGLKVNADEQAESVPDVPLDPQTQAKLDSQLQIAKSVALKYPTVADATHAGMILAGEFTPGAGAHYISMGGGARAFMGKNNVMDPAAPLAIIYDGTAPTSHVVGLMYGSYSLNPPEGFAGPNDHWHRHTNLCITFSGGKIGIPFPPDSDVTKAKCDAVHGMFMRRTLWMVHTWVVPGWQSPQGVFSHANINLHCGDGTDNTDAVGFCKGSVN
jgi:hypothetical protein